MHRIPTPGRATGSLAVALAAAGCAAPLSTLDPAGPSARLIGDMWWALLIGAALITALVAGLLAWAWFRGRPGAPKLWIVGGGIVFPLVTLAVLTGFALHLGERLLPHPAPGVVTVSAQGHRFWWGFVQPGPDGTPLRSATVLHIPAGRPVDVRISSADVIHSFWVPRLAGKLDAIPGHVNVLRLRADRPGIYAGHCAEFCGTGHSRNAFTVVAHPPADYLRAVAAATRTVPENAAFRRRCAQCHATDARRASPGPNLAGIATRPWPIAHALAGLDRDGLRRWIGRHAPAVRPDEIEPLLPYVGVTR